MDDYSAWRQLFQLTSLSVFSNQLSFHLEKAHRHARMHATRTPHTRPHMHTHAHIHTVLELVDLSLGYIISFLHHSAMTGPPRDTQ